MTVTPPPTAPPPDTRALGWLTAVKGLTISNAVVIVMLAIVVIPGYLLYRAVNDASLLDRLLSDYREISGQQSGCTERQVQQRGAPMNWGISAGFAIEGSDRYVVSVWMDHQPDNEQLYSYCETLKLIVDYMRDPAARSPKFPGTNKDVIWQYPSEASSGPP